MCVCVCVCVRERENLHHVFSSVNFQNIKRKDMVTADDRDDYGNRSRCGIDFHLGGKAARRKDVCIYIYIYERRGVLIRCYEIVQICKRLENKYMRINNVHTFLVEVLSRIVKTV